MIPGFYLLGDGAYQAVPGVIAPYRRSDDADKTLFNQVLRGARVRVEHAINFVKQEFGIVREHIRHSDRVLIATAIETACMLRNFMRRVRN